MQSNLFRAVAIILFGIVAFDLMAVTVRMLGSEYPILQISVLRNIFGIIPALLLLIIGPGLSSLRRIINRHNLKIIMIRSFAVLVAQFSYYTALTKIEFATAATLGFTSPFFVTLLSIPLLGHQIGLIRFAAILIGFLGVTAIFQPCNDSFTFWMLLPVLAGFGYGLSSVLVRLIPNEVPSAAIQISQQLLTCIFGFFFLATAENCLSKLQLKQKTKNHHFTFFGYTYMHKTIIDGFLHLVNQKCSFLFNIVQIAFDPPPPFVWTLPCNFFGKNVQKVGKCPSRQNLTKKCVNQ